jgi:hypothetical protein
MLARFRSDRVEEPSLREQSLGSKMPLSKNQIKGALDPTCSMVFVMPVDYMLLLRSGTLVSDNAVGGYMHLLAHKARKIGVPLSAMVPGFPPVLSSQGWIGVRKWLAYKKLSWRK